MVKQEFRQRISQQRKLILTDKLSKAFKLVQIPVTQEMIDEEENVIKLSSELFNQKLLRDILKRFRETQFGKDEPINDSE